MTAPDTPPTAPPPASGPALYAGTSGWAYAPWKPLFYPKEVPARRFLEHYSSRLNTVEVNASFRRIPTAAQVSAWLHETRANPGFRFSFKAPEQISHRQRLRDSLDHWRAFVSSLQPAVEAAKMAAVLLQFPPNFRAASKGKDKVINRDALQRFLAETGGSLRPRLAIEFRDPSWFAPEVLALLREHNVALCWADSDELKTPREQTAGFLYLRLRESQYSPEELAAESALLRDAATHTDVFCYYKHEEAPNGPLRAEQLLRRPQTAQTQPHPPDCV